MADKGAKGNLALIFGGGGDGAAAPEGGPSSDTDITELGADEEMAQELGEEADGMPAEFAVHAAEAFPELAGDDGRLEAFYRTIKACHPSA